METTHPLETWFTHLTSAIFILLGVATWALRWLVGVWTARVKAVPV